MALPAGSVRLIMRGTMLGIQDFSIGLGFISNYDPDMTFEDLDNWLGDLDTAVQALWTSWKILNPGSVVWQSLRAEYYAGGPTVSLIAERDSASNAGSSSADFLGTRAALVIGLTTGRPGRSYSGRVYVPATAVAISSTTNLVLAATANTARAALNTFLTATLMIPINVGGAALGVSPAILSSTLGVATPITSLRTDQLLDTQRRRENDFIPVYTTSGFPA